MNLKTPDWTTASQQPNTTCFQEAWDLHLTDISGVHSLWLRFDLLVSGNGFKRIAEVWATYFNRTPGAPEIRKTSIRQTHDLREFDFVAGEPSRIRIGECELSALQSKGRVQSKGQAISWDLRMIPRTEIGYDMVPTPLKHAHLVSNALDTANADLVINGALRINGEEIVLREAPGIQNHHSGLRSALDWTWAHCNQFRNEQGSEIPFVFEGITARAPLLGGLVAPRIKAFVFHYQGKTHAFHSLRDFLHINSNATLNKWTFKAERGDLSFRGEITAEHKAFAGQTHEDTDGSLIYVACAAFADLKIHVYRSGKLELSLLAPIGASLEVADRERNPYVSLLV